MNLSSDVAKKKKKRKKKQEGPNEEGETYLKVCDLLKQCSFILTRQSLQHMVLIQYVVIGPTFDVVKP
jgi:hypothetical protein